MCKELLRRNSLQIVAIFVALCITCPIFALDHFWTGAVSTDAANPRNWDNGTGNPTLPSAGDIVRIGCTSTWADYVPKNQPVLTSEWKGRNGGPSAGWWFVLGVGNQNTLTIGDGAYIEFSKNDCNLRNGGILHVTGQRTGGGPSIVIPPNYRIGNVGDSISGATGTIRIDDDGYLRFDPSVAVGGSGGTDIYMGSAANALIEIRDNGILETVSGTDFSSKEIVTPRFNFASYDSSVNKIVISGKGRLLVAGNPPVALAGGQERTIASLIDEGLITTDESGGILTISGVDPMVITLAERRITNPIPTDGNPDVVRDVVLSWDPSQLAEKYDIYLGTDSEIVSDANRANPLGVLISQNQVEACYPLVGTLSLDFGQKYYWRIDEVNEPSHQPIYKGKIWSFTVEPLLYSIPGQNITATVSSQLENQGPEKTIDGSGLVDDLHSTIPEDMWLGEADESGSIWIKYEFDKKYNLCQMMVWNYNGDFLLAGSGMKDVTIEYSTDGDNWTQLDGVTQFPQAPGAADSASDITVDFDGAAAKFIRITATSNWSGFFPQYGLSEVRFMYIPVNARMPNPDNGATEVAIDVILGWRAGREAAEHSLYISKDQQAVIEGTAPVVTANQPGYGPLSLDLVSTYYWRVDEVNNVNAVPIWEGDVWSFTTQDYLVVDDFEQYDDFCDRIFYAWIDGFGHAADPGCGVEPSNGNGTGSTVGNLDAPYAGQAIVHEGSRQSMPLGYDNSAAPYYSETQREWAVPQDLTKGGANALTLWFYGNLDNSAESLYVAVQDSAGTIKVVAHGNPDALQVEDWQEWRIELTEFDGVDLSSVKMMYIGVGNRATTQTGGRGTLLIDDIRLRP